MKEVLISVLLLQSYFLQIRGNVQHEMFNTWTKSEVTIFYPLKALQIQSAIKINNPDQRQLEFLSVEPDCYGYLLSPSHVLTGGLCFMDGPRIHIEQIIVAKANFGFSAENFSVLGNCDQVPEGPFKPQKHFVS